MIRESNLTKARFFNHLIRLKLFPKNSQKYFMQNYTYFKQIYDKCYKQNM